VIGSGIVRYSGFVAGTSKSLSNIPDNTYTRRIYAIDKLGNTGGRSDTWDFRIDTTKPTADVEYTPTSGTWTSGNVQAIITGFSELIT
jgi:hypothetical protein